MSHVTVVGGGLGGLTAACTLAARGHDVELFERNSWLGGKAAALRTDGYRFDMGPTILTLPSVLRRIFAEADREMDERLYMEELAPQWRCFFDDDSVFDLHSSVDQTAAAMEQFSPHAGIGKGYRAFMAESEEMHELTRKFFFWKPVGGLRDMVQVGRSSAFNALSSLESMKMGRTVAGRTRHYLHDSRLSQMADHLTQYVGSSPFLSPAILCGIAHMQTEGGIWYPHGGIRAVPDALDELARELGVTVHTDSPVRRIRAEGGGVRGVETAGGETMDSQAVVCNMDCVRAHRELLPERVGGPFLARRTYEPACSGVVLYLGLNRRYEKLLHHNFVFSGDAEEEFHSIYERKKPAPDPTCYVCAPSRTDPTAAPEGGESLYVLTHTPALQPHHDWEKMLPSYRKRILQKLEETAGLAGLEDAIEVEKVLTPEDIREKYAVLDGAIYGLASHGRFTGALKPGNRSPDLDGLYMAGGSVHPGPGVPMALMSGWIAADALHRDRPG